MTVGTLTDRRTGRDYPVEREEKCISVKTAERSSKRRSSSTR